MFNPIILLFCQIWNNIVYWYYFGSNKLNIGKKYDNNFDVIKSNKHCIRSTNIQIVAPSNFLKI